MVWCILKFVVKLKEKQRPYCAAHGSMSHNLYEPLPGSKGEIKLTDRESWNIAFQPESSVA